MMVLIYREVVQDKDLEGMVGMGVDMEEVEQGEDLGQQHPLASHRLTIQHMVGKAMEIRFRLSLCPSILKLIALVHKGVQKVFRIITANNQTPSTKRICKILKGV